MALLISWGQSISRRYWSDGATGVSHDTVAAPSITRSTSSCLSTAKRTAFLTLGLSKGAVSVLITIPLQFPVGITETLNLELPSNIFFWLNLTYLFISICPVSRACTLASPSGMAITWTSAIFGAPSQ